MEGDKMAHHGSGIEALVASDTSKMYRFAEGGGTRVRIAALAKTASISCVPPSVILNLVPGLGGIF